MMKKKKCCNCKEELDVGKFKTRKGSSDGLQSQCIECQKKYRREHYLKNKQKYIDKSAVYRNDFICWWKEYKKQFCCSECGESHPACICFHHDDDNKCNDVSTLVAWRGKQKIIDEISKCTPLCNNCHAKKHWKDESDIFKEG